MKRKALFVCLVLALAAMPAGVAAQSSATDPEIDKGIRLADEGEYDAAIVVLDGAARRLAADPKGSAELARAYLHLGIAYLAKGYETSARARFRDALASARDLELKPEKFPPRVIELFEQARQDMAVTGAARPSSPAPPAAKKGGGKGLLIAGGVAAVAGGAALALGGGGGDDPGGPPGNPTQNFSGQLDGATGSVSAQYALAPFPRSGRCEARLTWSDGRTEVRMFVLEAASGSGVAETNRVTPSSSAAQWNCSSSTTYRIDLFLQEPPLRVTYELQVTVS